MNQLVELGAAHLIELGSPPNPVQSPVLDLFQIVNFLETPYAGIELEPGESISARQRALAERLRTLSMMERRALVNRQGLKGLGYVDLIDEMAGLARELDGLYRGNQILGKSFKKKLKSIGKKVVKVVKSPAFLSVVGVAANLIPGVGQIASAALLTTAGVMAKKQQEKKAKKEMKKAEQEAARQAAAQDEAALNAYYGQYHVDYLDPMGYTPDVWTRFTLEQKRTTIEKLADGTLQPYGAPAAVPPPVVTPTVAPVSQAARDEVAKAAALSIAMKNEYGTEIGGSGIDPNTLPPDIRAQAQALAPKMEQQIEATGKENFLATVKKAIGQAGALDSFFKGAGAELPGGVGDIFSKFGDSDALKAGVQDLKNTGAAVGEEQTVTGLIDAGASRFPWEYAAAGAGGIVLLTGAIYVVTRG